MTLPGLTMKQLTLCKKHIENDQAKITEAIQIKVGSFEVKQKNTDRKRAKIHINISNRVKLSTEGLFDHSEVCLLNTYNTDVQL